MQHQEPSRHRLSRGISSCLPQRQNGQTLVEFLLIVVIFFFILMFGLQWCYISIAKSLLNVGVHAAARVLAVDQDMKKARKAVFHYVEPITESVDDVTVFISNPPDNFGEAYKVRASMRLSLLPFPITYGLFQDNIIDTPTQHKAYSFSHTPPTRHNLVNSQGEKFTLDEDEMITVLDSKFFGWEWVRYRWVVHAHYHHSHKTHDKYVTPPRNKHDDNPWPNEYFETKRHFPHEHDVPAWDDPPSQHFSHDHTSFSAVNMTPSYAKGPPPATFGDGQDIYGPKIYKWTLLITKKGHRVVSQKKDEIHLYAWTAMSAD